MDEKIALVTTILTTIGAVIGWVWERRSNRADIFTKMQEAYEKYVEHYERRYKDSLIEFDEKLEDLKQKLKKCLEKKGFDLED